MNSYDAAAAGIICPALVVGGMHVGKSGVFGGGLQVGPGKGGPARVRVRSADGEATLTLSTAARGESAGVEFKADDKVGGGAACTPFESACFQLLNLMVSALGSNT